MRNRDVVSSEPLTAARGPFSPGGEAPPVSDLREGLGRRLGAREARRCAALALAAAAAVLLWQELTIRYHFHGNRTALFCTGSKQVVPPQFRAGTYVFKNSYGYDGQFYRYIAHDPFFKRGFAQFIDSARHRYGRILIPTIAWTLAAGHDTLIDWTFQWTVVLFCGLGVYWVCAYLTTAGCNSYWGVAFLLLPATLTSIDRMLVDGALCALFAGYLYFLRLGRYRTVFWLTMLAPLARETGILLLAGVVFAAVARKEWKRAFLFSTAAIPACIWALFVAVHTAPSPAAQIIDKPVAGLFIRLFTLLDYPLAPPVRLAVQASDLLAMAGFILCLGMAAKWIWDARGEEPTASYITLVCFLLLGLLLGGQEHLKDAYGYARPLSPLLLWVTLRAIRTRTWTALLPPAFVSANIGLYFVLPMWSILRGVFGG